MQLGHLLVLTGITACQGWCNPLRQLWTPKVRGFAPHALPAQFPSEIVVFLESGGPQSSGLTLLAANGSEVASIACELTEKPSKYAVGGQTQVTCPTPPLAPGSYSARFSGDRACGAKSYAPLDGAVDVIEPAHVAAASPAHGPEKASTSVTISGSNFGGPSMGCRFTFVPAPGAKFGCSMTQADYGAFEVTPTSVVCHVPAWPGPLEQSHGAQGLRPVDGAVCSRDVHVQISNDARVHSQEPLVFHYDEEDAQRVLV